jgi:hypothetical protein
MLAMTSGVCAPLVPAGPRLDDASFVIGAHQRLESPDAVECFIAMIEQG